MRLLVLQHVPFEGPARIIGWADAYGHTIIRLHTYQGCQFPTLDSFDALVLMGGPMGANDTLPWLRAETAFVERAIAAGKKVLGICLGAQIIANILGARVYAQAEREIGWFPVRRSDAAKPDNWLASALPTTFTPLHWHGDTFEPPTGAECVYASDYCSQQAFTVDKQLLGFQFHLELTRDSALRIGEACADELRDGGRYVQSLDTIVADKMAFTDAHRLLYIALDTFFGY